MTRRGQRLSLTLPLLPVRTILAGVGAAIFVGGCTPYTFDSTEATTEPTPVRPIAIAFKISGDIRQVDCDVIGTKDITYTQGYVPKITVRTDQRDVTISGTATYGDGTTETLSGWGATGVDFPRGDLKTLSVVATGSSPSNVATLDCTATAVVQASLPPGLTGSGSGGGLSLVDGTQRKIAKYLTSNFDGTYWLPWIDSIGYYRDGAARNLDITINGFIASDQELAREIAQTACIAIYQWWIDEVRNGNQAFEVLFVGSSLGNVYRREDFARGENCLGN